MTDLLSSAHQVAEVSPETRVDGEADGREKTAGSRPDQTADQTADQPAQPLASLIVSGASGDRSWVTESLCAGKTHLFFAPPGERRTRRNKREALAMSYCNQCTVADECRSWARENRESGFWGGENEEQRAAAGFAPRSPNRRAVADAAREARKSA